MRTAHIPDGTPVYIYWNLKKHCYSVKSRQKAEGYRVIAHVDQFALEGIEFRVSKAGRNKVLRERRKNVHAGLAGTWIERTTTGAATRVTYDPYEAETFFIKDTKKPIHIADQAIGRVVNGKAVVLV